MAGDLVPSARILRRLAPRDRVAALAAALGVTTGPAAAGLAAELLTTPGVELEPHPLAAAARVWPALDLATRAHLLAAGGGRWGQIAGILAADRRSESRLALLQIVAERPDPALVSILPDLMADADPSVAEAAGERLLALCAEAPGLVEVEEAAARAFETFAEHRRPAAAMAVALLAARLDGVRPGGRLAAIVSDHELAGHSALRRLIRRGGVVGPEQVWLWLRHPVWAGACVERITADDEDRAVALRGAMLDRAHLVENPVRRRHLARARAEAARGGGAGGGAEARPLALDEPGWRIGAGARLLAAAGARAAEFDRWAAPLLSHPAAAARAGIGRTAAAMLGRPAVLLDLCFDADARTAHSALLALRPWRRVGYLPDADVDRTVRAAARSVHPRVRALASGLRIPPEAWGAGGADAARGRLSARAALAADREGALAHIRARLAGAGPAARGAVALAAHLGLLRELEPVVLELARAAPDPRLRATAAAALGHSTTPEAWAELERLVLGDADARVRSNALEALGRRSRRDRRAGGRVHDLAAEVQRTDAHRLRGAALRARLLSGRSDPDAVAALGAMLSDSRPAHRAAALWLAERAAPGSASGGWGQVAARVAEIACADADPGVRARAERCSRTLMARLRSAWTVRVRDLAPPAVLPAEMAV